MAKPPIGQEQAFNPQLQIRSLRFAGAERPDNRFFELVSLVPIHCGTYNGFNWPDNGFVRHRRLNSREFAADRDSIRNLSSAGNSFVSPCFD
jgi:hypothetical protein